jgi:imidazolonepropionase
MGRATLVRGARQLLTLRGPPGPRRGPALNDLGIIEDGAVLIRDGRIVSVGPSRRLENLREARDAELLDATGQVVMPGLVDGCIQLGSGAPLSLSVETRPGSGEPSPAALPPFTSRRRLHLEIQRKIGQLIRHGTTALELKTPLIREENLELRLLRVLAALRGNPLDLVPTLMITWEERARPDPLLEFYLARLLPVLRQRRLVRFVEFCCVGDRPSTDRAQRCLSQAVESGFGVKLQGPPTAELVSLALSVQATSVTLLGNMGREEIHALSSSSVIATLVPAAALAPARGCPPPARDLIAAGAAISLASGYGVLGSTYSMPVVLSLACSHLELKPAEAIAAATINAAYSVGLGSLLGSLEPGKQADLLIFDAPDYREIPYHLGVNLVHAVLKRGKLIYRRGEILWDTD